MVSSPWALVGEVWLVVASGVVVLVTVVGVVMVELEGVVGVVVGVAVVTVVVVKTISDLSSVREHKTGILRPKWVIFVNIQSFNLYYLKI